MHLAENIAQLKDFTEIHTQLIKTVNLACVGLMNWQLFPSSYTVVLICCKKIIPLAVTCQWLVFDLLGEEKYCWLVVEKSKQTRHKLLG